MANASSPAVHNISFIGVTGAIFACLAIGFILFCEAFVSANWLVEEHDDNATYVGSHGLWNSYWTRASEYTSFANQKWFLASQILFCAALFGFLLSFILIVIYLSANKASKNMTISALVFITFLTVCILVAGLVLFGIKTPEKQTLSWSYILSAVATGLCFFAGILTIVQIRKSNVRIC